MWCRGSFFNIQPRLRRGLRHRTLNIEVEVQSWMLSVGCSTFALLSLLVGSKGESQISAAAGEPGRVSCFEPRLRRGLRHSTTPSSWPSAFNHAFVVAFGIQPRLRRGLRHPTTPTSWPSASNHAFVVAFGIQPRLRRGLRHSTFVWLTPWARSCDRRFHVRLTVWRPGSG